MQSRVLQYVRNDSGFIESELMNNQLRPKCGRAGSERTLGFSFFLSGGKVQSCLNGSQEGTQGGWREVNKVFSSQMPAMNFVNWRPARWLSRHQNLKSKSVSGVRIVD